jgi:hypothetical protein
MGVVRSGHAGELHGPLVQALARSRFAAQGEGLVSWDELEESERARHEGAARQVLQDILEAGYQISRPPASAAEPGVAAPLALLDGDHGLTACREQAERFLRSGEPLLAYNAVQEGLEKWTADLRLRQLQSLALARSGAVARANEGLQKLREEGHADAETLGLLARTHKDLATSAGDAESRRVHLQAAFDLYDEAYRRACRQGDAAEAYYTGINAATLALLRGDIEGARQTARQVRALCEGEIARAGASGSDYWVRATLAEAALILGERQEARKRAELRRIGDIQVLRALEKEKMHKEEQ